jgi:hypothetical protein
MKHHFTLSRRNSTIISLCLLFLNMFIECQDHVYATHNPLSLPIKALSEQGKVYFEQMQKAKETKQFGFISPFASHEQDGHALVKQDGIEVTFDQGVFTGQTTCSDYTVRGNTDLRMGKKL